MNLARARAGDVLIVDEGTGREVMYNILNIVARQELDVSTFRLERIIEKNFTGQVQE